MAAICEEIARTMPPLRGIVHAAGVIRDAVLIHQRWDAAKQVFRGKLHGAWLLHELTRTLPLDFFILYSAAGVVLGAPGQGLYPAANAGLDALAMFRRRLGLHALSVAWGSWSGAGMAADLAERGQDVWQARGLKKIDPSLGFRRAGAAAGGRRHLCRRHADRLAAILAPIVAGGRSDFFDAVGPVAMAPAATPVRPRMRQCANGCGRRRPGQRHEAVAAQSDGSRCGRCSGSISGMAIALEGSVEGNRAGFPDGGGDAKHPGSLGRQSAAGDTTVRLSDPRRTGSVSRLRRAWDLEDAASRVREPADRALATRRPTDR